MVISRLPNPKNKIIFTKIHFPSMTLKKASLLIIVILIIDQASKLYVKTHFTIGEDVQVFSWFKILFIENPGMAWGTKLSDFVSFISDGTAKVMLTIFRIIAVCFIGYWLIDSIRRHANKVLVIGVSLILAGALGNIIDSVFYGILFTDSNGAIAEMFHENGGYGHLLQGKVVDMLYFPIWKGYLPEWLPFWGGKYFTFFEPVFNVADVAISSGVGLLLVFNKKAFRNNSEMPLEN